MQAKVGDTVRFLNTTGGGKLIRIEGQMAYVDDDGFETPVLLRECVPVASGNSFVPPTPRPALDRQQAQAKAAAAAKSAAAPAASKCADKAPAAAHEPDELPYIETKAGEHPNIVLGFEPRDARRVTDGNIDVYLVNDSNYYLYLVLLCRADADQPWTTLYTGLIQPGIQQLCAELDRSRLGQLEQLSLQYVAYKKTGMTEPMAPVSVQWSLDVTKLVKLHCFKRHPYFDVPVIAFDIMRDGRPGMQKVLEVDSERLAAALNGAKPAAKDSDRRGPAQSKPSQARRAAGAEPLVVDLHAGEILPDQRGLKPGDILQYQLAYFREVMDANLRNHGQKIIFIHGKGDGVLRQNLLKELQHRYRDHDVQDASFREYGFGASQVTIK